MSDPITSPSHYTGRGGIEPIDFIVSNGYDFLEGNVVKYLHRYKGKNGLQDLRKCHQYLTWLIQREMRNAPEEVSKRAEDANTKEAGTYEYT